MKQEQQREGKKNKAETAKKIQERANKERGLLKQPPLLLCRFQDSLASTAAAVSVCADTTAISTAAENKDEPDEVIVSTSTAAVIAIIAA